MSAASQDSWRFYTGRRRVGSRPLLVFFRFLGGFFFGLRRTENHGTSCIRFPWGQIYRVLPSPAHIQSAFVASLQLLSPFWPPAWTEPLGKADLALSQTSPQTFSPTSNFFSHLHQVLFASRTLDTLFCASNVVEVMALGSNDVGSAAVN